MHLLESPLWRGVALLMGVTIGAGILGIPYAFSQVGLVSALITFVVAGLLVLIVQLYLGELALSTKEPHQLPGLAPLHSGGRIPDFQSPDFVLLIFRYPVSGPPKSYIAQFFVFQLRAIVWRF